MRTVVVSTAAVLVLVGCSADDRPPPNGQPTSQASSPKPIASATTTSAPDVLGGLPLGQPPRIGYAAGVTYRSPEGRKLRLPNSFITGIEPVADGVLVTDQPFEGSVGLHLVNPAGTRDLGPCSSGEPAVNSDGTVIAWTSFACPESGQTAPTLLHWEDGSGATRTLPITGRLPSVAGMVGDEVVYSTESGTFRTDLLSPPRRVPGVTWAVDVDARRGLVLGSLGRGRLKVTDIETGKALWGAERARLRYGSRFSPDGSMVLSRGTRPRVLDSATGALLHVIALPHSITPWAWAWEGNRHLLVAVAGARTSAVLRVGLVGELERTTAIVKLRGRGQVFFL